MLNTQSFNPKIAGTYIHMSYISNNIWHIREFTGTKNEKTKEVYLLIIPISLKKAKEEIKGEIERGKNYRQ